MSKGGHVVVPVPEGVKPKVGRYGVRAIFTVDDKQVAHEYIRTTQPDKAKLLEWFGRILDAN